MTRDQAHRIAEAYGRSGCITLLTDAIEDHARQTADSLAAALESALMCGQHGCRSGSPSCRVCDAQKVLESYRTQCTTSTIDAAQTEAQRPLLAEIERLTAAFSAQMLELSEALLLARETNRQLVEAVKEASTAQKEKDARLCREIAVACFHCGDETAARSADVCNLAIRNQTSAMKEEPK